MSGAKEIPVNDAAYLMAEMQREWEEEHPEEASAEKAKKAAPKQALATQRYDHEAQSSFDIAVFVSTYLDAFPPEAYQGGSKWVLRVCPFEPDHRTGQACVFQFASGAVAFKCLGARCVNMDWHALRAKYEPRVQRALQRQQPQAMQHINADRPTLYGRLASEIVHRRVDWLWQGIVARRCLTILGGAVGVGKSSVTRMLTAAVTNPAQSLPDGARIEANGSVIWFNAEENLEEVAAPALQLAGADLTRVKFIEGVKRADDSTWFGLDEHLECLNEALDAATDTRLVIFDPIASHFGGIDANDNKGIRRLLEDLQRLSIKRDIAILGIGHLNKSTGPAIQRIAGATSITGVARRVSLLAFDVNDPDNNRRLLMCLKPGGNAPHPTLAYSIQGGLPAWELGHSHENANAMLDYDEMREGGRMKAAMEFLADLLTGNQMDAKDVLRLAKQEGISEKTIRIARETLERQNRFERERGLQNQSRWFIRDVPKKKS